MAKMDAKLKAILDKYHDNPKAAIWDCHGRWVIYHSAVEEMAVKAGITFSMPTILEANGAAKSVALCVEGQMGERREWSVGEAAPGNNKNSYPYAMAEKRAKDRVVLKLLGLHGLVYSEEEADDLKDAKPAPTPEPAPAAPAPLSAKVREYAAEIMGCMDDGELKAFGAKRAQDIGKLSPEEQEHLRIAYNTRRAHVSEREAA